MSLLVKKFGGTSVGSTEKIKNVARRIKKDIDNGDKVVVVVSAMGKTTDELISLAEEVTSNATGREMDRLLSTGEQVTIALLAMALLEMGVNAISLTGTQAGMSATSVYGKARIQQIKPERIHLELEKNDVVVVAGFQGYNETTHDIVTLGRGGSDLSAVALAASIKADVCEVFTDVDGVYTTDPRIVKDAKKINQISYEEMLELASLGASVMQSRSIEVADKFGVVIHVRSSFNEEEGTIIKKEDESMENVLVRGIARDVSESKVTLVGVPDKPGLAALIFQVLADKDINVDMIIQNVSHLGKTDISFTVKNEDLKLAKDTFLELAKIHGIESVITDEDIAKISIVGVGMKSHTGVASKTFSVLAENEINIGLISTSEIKISVVVSRDKSDLAMNALHKAFDLA